MKKILVAIILFCLIGLQGCGANTVEETKIPASTANTSTPSPQQTATSASTVLTQIVIDGFGGEWGRYPEVGNDPAGDQVAGSPDLAELRAFNNDRYFYLLIALHENGSAEHYDILIDVDGGDFDFQISVWPESNQAVFSVFPITGGMQPIEGVSAAQAAQIEVKIPLSAVGGESVKNILVQTNYSGSRGDVVEGTRIRSLAETEPAAVAILATPTPSGPVALGTLLDKSLTLKIMHSSGTKIDYLRVGSNNEVFTIDVQGDTIYRLLPNGTLEEYLQFPGTKIDYFNIAPDGTFWFINNRDWGLYHVDDQGKPRLIANRTNRLFDFDSAGNLFAVDGSSDNVQKITPDGKVETIASGFQSQLIAVGPDDSVYIVTFNGELARVEADGSLKVIATGFGVEDAPAFTPDGTLYLMGWNGLTKVDPSTGKVERINWVKGIGGRLVFDQLGKGYIIHPNNPLYRIDLESETVEVVYSPYGNSYAMAVDPLTETIYVAYGDRVPQGKTSLFRVGENGKLEEFGSVPYGTELFISFAADGTGYLSVVDSDKGSMIYIFKPQEGTLEEFQRPDCVAQSMAVEPGTNALWWTDCNKLVSYSADLGRRTIPYLEGVNSSTFAFGSEGALYALVWFRAQAFNLPMPHGIYRYENGNWVQLNDMTAKHPGVTVAELTACPDGHVYVGGTVEDKSVPGGLDFASVLRLENDNSLSLIGYGLGSFDILAVSCAPSGTLYFTNAQGIYGIPYLGAAP
jgi:sugar lactone lactonase YvrE